MWVLLFLASASSASPTPFDDARWISPKGSVANGTFAAYRTTVVPRSGPCRNASLRVAADTKFWLWVNGKPVAWEGGLKRGPSPQAGYYDVIDLSTAPWGAGPSTVAVLVLYLGRRTVRTIRFGIPGSRSSKGRCRRTPHRHRSLGVPQIFSANATPVAS